MSNLRLNRIIILAVVAFITAICITSSWSQATKGQKPKGKTTQRDPYSRPEPRRPIRPEIPGANRYQPDKVFLEYADELVADEDFGSDRQVLRGNVKFRKQGMYMYCDSAYFYPETNSLDAFGHVRMEQGDTILVNADVLYYDGLQETAKLRYRGNSHVQLELTSKSANNKKILTTDSLDYDLAIETATYFEGGELLNRNLRTLEQDTLTSDRGIYDMRSKEVELLGNVWMRNKKSDLKTNRLLYNTDTHIAQIVEMTEIKSGDDNIITSSGWYNTDTGDAEMHDRSIVIHRDDKNRATTLEGDSMVYDNATRTSYVYQYAPGQGRIPRPMVLRDTANKTILIGGYGYYNDSTREAFATYYPLLIEYSREDSLFLRADSIRTILDIKTIVDSVTDTLQPGLVGTTIERYDTARIAMAYRRARFYRNDLQGIADSIAFVERDSMLHLFYSPILWSGKRQVTGALIDVHFNDSTADYAHMPEFGLVSEQVEDDYFNQLSAKKMTAWFENSSLSRLFGDGNVQAIMLPMEKDSTYNKLVWAESSMLNIDMNDSTMERLKMWPDVAGTVTPIFAVKKTQLHLPDFHWYEELRPQKADDLGEVSDKLEQYFLNSTHPANRSRKTRNTKKQ